MKKFLLFCLINLCFIVAKAQPSIKKDTLYYLLDIEKTPLNDRMITVEREPPYVHYIINCPCLKNGNKPSLRENETRRSIISAADVSKIKFITLSDIIDKIKAEAYERFQQTHVFFLIAPTKDGYTQNRAFLDEEPREPAIHYDIRPAPKVKKPTR